MRITSGLATMDCATSRPDVSPPLLDLSVAPILVARVASAADGACSTAPAKTESAGESPNPQRRRVGIRSRYDDGRGRPGHRGRGETVGRGELPPAGRVGRDPKLAGLAVRPADEAVRDRDNARQARSGRGHRAE